MTDSNGTHAELEACLPADLRTSATAITRVAAGLSGAGVYRVDSGGKSYILKVASSGASLDEWLGRLHIQQHASDAGLAPTIVHVDEGRRAIVSAFVVDRSFPALYMNPASRESALVKLAAAIRKVHELPLPADAEWKDPVSALATVWSELTSGFAVPPFVHDVVQRVLSADPPPREHALVLSHNDVNPSNIVYDGERLLLLDWDVAGANDPLYDLATISVFLRMDDESCARLLSLHGGTPVTSLPPRFNWNRRVISALCGVLFLNLSRIGGHAPATGGETLESAPSLGEFMRRMMIGELSPATPEGQWWFGVALAKASAGF